MNTSPQPHPSVQATTQQPAAVITAPRRTWGMRLRMAWIFLLTLLYRAQLWMLTRWGRLAGLSVLNQAEYRHAVTELAKTVTYVDQSGMLPGRYQAKMRLLVHLHDIVSHFAMAEKLASPKHFQQTMEAYTAARWRAMSRRAKDKALGRRVRA